MAMEIKEYEGFKPKKTGKTNSKPATKPTKDKSAK